MGAWARYRWGVFEERGYEGDPKFPVAHMMDDVPKPTSCTNEPTEGQWISRKGYAGESDRRWSISVLCLI